MIRRAVLSVLFAISVCFHLLAPGALCQEATVPAPASSGPPEEELTLDQAVALALKNNRLLKNAALEVDKAGDQLGAARTFRLPTINFYAVGSQLLTPVDFEFRRGVFGTFPATGPIPSEDTRISTPRRPNLFVVASATQPVSQLYRIGLGVQMRQLTQEIDRQRLRSERQSLVNDVKRAYYGVLEAQSAIEASEEALKQYRELDRVVRDYVTQQVALQAESLAVKSRLANEEYKVLSLRNTLETRKEQLNDLLGRDIRIGYSVRPVPEATLLEADLQAARARALEQRPEVKEARLRAKQAEYDRRIKKSEYIPDVSLSLRYISLFNIEVLPKNVASVGLLVSWDPLDWGRKNRELAEKSKTIEQANNGLSEAETRVLIDVNSRFRKLQETGALLRVSQMAREATREKLRVLLNKYTQQAVQLKEVLEAQASLAEANHQFQQALLAFWTARADFEKALGEE